MPMKVVSKMMAVLLFSWAAAASGQAYPSRSVRVIVPRPPGDGADFVTRVFSKALSERLWVGLLAPAGTPADIIAKLNVETVKAAQLPDVRERLAGEGTEPLEAS